MEPFSKAEATLHTRKGFFKPSMTMGHGNGRYLSNQPNTVNTIALLPGRNATA